MAESKPLQYQWDDELTDKEVHFIGKVVAHWGAIEHEVFIQVAQSFDQPEVVRSKPPKELRKAHFADVLKLWRNRVIEHAEGERKQVLQAQFVEIQQLAHLRHALVHSMLSWGSGDLGEITAIRTREDQLIEVVFTTADLSNLHSRLAAVNFNLRYPGGRDAWAAEVAKGGCHISRRAMGNFTGHTIIDEWLSDRHRDRQSNAEDPASDA